jgi:hypothetical protein
MRCILEYITNVYSIYDSVAQPKINFKAIVYLKKFKYKFGKDNGVTLGNLNILESDNTLPYL